ncbi:MAG: exodeoxyribonuclease VII large subunit [Thermodesulfobacteriota bacterium]
MNHIHPQQPVLPEIYTVSRLTQEVRRILEESFPSLWVEGEISNCHHHSSGHLYLTLKDERCQIRAVMFKAQARQLAFEPQDGMHVLCLGRVGVYEARGEYQLYLDFMEPRGIGALLLAFDQLKTRLSREGLFDAARKRALPFLPRTIGIVTSPTGAVIRDMLQILRRRFPNLHVLLRPAKVQGEGAAQDIVQGIQDLNQWPGIEVIVLARGGGSMEDLWAFNQEEVARAIASSSLPVVSAVGHEVDYTISDFVSDLRAPTPSAAAELLVPVRAELERHLEEINRQLAASMTRKLKALRDELENLAKRHPDPRRRIAQERLALDEIQGRMTKAMGISLERSGRELEHLAKALSRCDPRVKVESLGEELQNLHQRLVSGFRFILQESRFGLERQAAMLHSMSPLQVLARGYSIVRLLPQGDIVRDSSRLSAGDRLRITFHRGEATCKVEPS